MNEGAPIQSFEVAVSAVSIAHIQKICPNVEGAWTFLTSTQTYWIWRSVLPAGEVVSADGSTGATTSSPGGFWVNSGVGTTGGGAALPQVNTIAVGAVGSGRLVDLAVPPAGGETSVVFVKSVLDFFRWDPVSTTAADAISVVALLANGVAAGR